MMLRLPSDLERRLASRFPRESDRERFVRSTLEEALAGDSPEATQPKSVGGVLHLFSDGGSRGNPGHAAIACILEDPVSGSVLAEHFERIGIETNNVAEYRALIAGLTLALQYQPSRLICHLDSELIVKQLNGEYRVKMETLKPLVEQIEHLCQDLADVVFTHVPREDNYRADALVNRALDELPDPTPHKSPRPPSPRLFEDSSWH